MEWFGLERTFKDHLVQSPCHGQGHLPYSLSFLQATTMHQELIKLHMSVADAKMLLMLQIIHCAYFLPEHMHQILVHLQKVYVAQTLEENGFRAPCSGKEASNCKMSENRIRQQKYMLQFILLRK